MVQCLRSALQEGRPVSSGDAVFYTHEIAETTKMRQLVREGLSFDDAYKIAHPATIQKYGVSDIWGQTLTLPLKYEWPAIISWFNKNSFNR